MFMLDLPDFTSKKVSVRKDRIGKRLCLARLKSSLNPKSIAPLRMGFALSRLGFGSVWMAFSPAPMGLSLAPQK